MSSLLIFWLGAGIIFLIIEMITSTFYGLSLAIAAFVLTGYIWITGDTELSILQGIIFVVISALCSYFFPMWFMNSTKDQDRAQGLDIYLGQVRKVKKSGEDYKVTLDGVDYTIDNEDIKNGDKVRLVSRKGSVFHAETL